MKVARLLTVSCALLSGSLAIFGPATSSSTELQTLEVIVGGASRVLTFNPGLGPDGLASSALEFVSTHGLEQGYGCSEATCVVAKLVDSMQEAAGIGTADDYLDLLRASVKGLLHTRRMHKAVNDALGFTDLWPGLALSMVDEPALASLRWMLETCVSEGLRARRVLEAGVWRGGTSIYAAGVLKRAVQKTGPGAGGWTVILCDSFRGLPLSSSSRDHDWWWEQRQLKVGVAEVIETWRAHFPTDDVPIRQEGDASGDAAGASGVSARTFAGFVREYMPRVAASLPWGPEGDLAVLRVDVDMFEGYLDVLFRLAHRVPPGGFMVMDDYFCASEARQAVDAFRAAHGVDAPLVRSGACVGWWRVPKRVTLDPALYEAFNALRSPPAAAEARAVSFGFFGHQSFSLSLAPGAQPPTVAALACRQARERFPADFAREFGHLDGQLDGDLGGCAEQVVRVVGQKLAGIESGERDYLGQDLGLEV